MHVIKRPAVEVDAQAFLIEVAERARRWFDNRLRGNALNGPNDDVMIGRDLETALRAVEQEQDAAEVERRR